MHQKKSGTDRQAFMIPVCFALISAGVGVWLAYGGTIHIWKVVSSSTWSSVSGHVISAEMRPCGRSGKPDCHPEIKYEYEFDGQLYLGSVINPVKEGGYTEPEAKELLNRFGQGSVIT